MLDKVINTRALNILELGLEGATLRQKVIANNLANVDTPGYKALEVTFEDKLRELCRTKAGSQNLKTNHPRHLREQEPVLGNPELFHMEGYTLRNDKNNIDIDREMARLAKNSIYYDAVTQSINNEFRLLRMAITEGRR